jgi:predicted MPP superfamily phosphohydrolase
MKKWLKRISLGILALLLVIAGMTAYAYYIEPRRLTVYRADLKVPNFSAGLNGLKIVAISDIHGGSNNVPEAKLRKIVELANAQEPDLIVLLGDYVSQIEGRSSPLKMPVETIAENLKGFRAKYGVYGVIGNHDWWYDDKKVTEELEKAGIDILENEIEPIKIGNETVWLWGIEDYWRARRVPIENSFAKILDKKNIIAITHNPDSLLKAPEEISVMLAGHSHGGQIWIPFYGRKNFSSDQRFVYGPTQVDGKHVFVTAGIGTSVYSFRFLTPPEIAVITLSSE